jgi:hypothetical protein
MRKLYLPLHRIRPLAFYRGINTEPRVFVCSFLAFCDRILFPFPPSAVLHCRHQPFPVAIVFQSLR